MKKLYLRGCKNTYYKLDKKRKYTVYHDPINNNLIIFSPYNDCTVDSVCGSIRDEAYLYLINELNINKNIVASWSQIAGTTSDYIIYYDMDVDMLKGKSHKEILTIINNNLNINSGDCCGYKYIQVKDGKEDKITPEGMEQFNMVMFNCDNSEYIN